MITIASVICHTLIYNNNLSAEDWETQLARLKHVTYYWRVYNYNHINIVSIFIIMQVLVLAPTRELAIQVAKDFKDITKKLSVHCFYGGSSYNPQGST